MIVMRRGGGLIVGAGALCISAATLHAGVLELQPKMGEPLNGLTPEQLEKFLEGRVSYDTPLSIREGLGPIFNKESCGNCHATPLGGAVIAIDFNRTPAARVSARDRRRNLSASAAARVASARARPCSA